MEAARLVGRAAATRRPACAAPTPPTESPAATRVRAQADNVVTRRTTWRAHPDSRAVRRYRAMRPLSAARRTSSARAGAVCQGARTLGRPVVGLVSLRQVALQVQRCAAPTTSVARPLVWVSAVELAQ